MYAVALVVGGVAGVEAAVRGPRVVDAQSVLQGGVTHRLLGPALTNIIMVLIKDWHANLMQISYYLKV